jgi:hypothetical protein
MEARPCHQSDVLNPKVPVIVADKVSIRIYLGDPKSSPRLLKIERSSLGRTQGARQLICITKKSLKGKYKHEFKFNVWGISILRDCPK